MLVHLWVAGARRPATPLHSHHGPGDHGRRPDGSAPRLGQQRKALSQSRHVLSLRPEPLAEQLTVP